MKKVIAVALSLMLVASMTCALAGGLLGGWNVAESTEVTEEQKAVLDKALEKLVGVNYEPVAYLGSQMVSGTNHCFLCKATVVYPNAVPSLALVFVYENLEGAAEITQITDLDLAALSIPTEAE